MVIANSSSNGSEDSLAKPPIILGISINRNVQCSLQSPLATSSTSPGGIAATQHYSNCKQMLTVELAYYEMLTLGVWSTILLHMLRSLTYALQDYFI